MKVVMAVRDAKTEMFGNPFFAVSIGDGVRGFTSEVNRDSGESMLRLYPEDFSLWMLGEFDEASGAFLVEGTVPKLVISGTDVKRVLDRGGLSIVK